ncbi:GNAT family N-acetyltransferase [Couchioplanes caeruleus]|uniref:GNAT family N-acetyltransferase n=1 Tax=Couchioplanes caeruleus TaxID=56438 RepID=UPI0020C092C3|nr:GNAT family N-acetyltransferase [Couchioplanes caeruleus]UQU66607.1 GNAT family N-acetyltransferase [Couchioplanes caeruleus]
MVRDRQTEDLEECVRLLRDVHEADGYPMNWPADPIRWLSPPGRHLVALRDGAVAGHVVVTAAGELSRLFVDPARRGLGLASLLVSAAERYGARRLEVVDGRVAGFYERLGWTLTGTKRADWDASVHLRCYRKAQ